MTRQTVHAKKLKLSQTHVSYLKRYSIIKYSLYFILVIAIRCQCTEDYCDNILGTCHSKYRYCFTRTTGNKTSRGCLDYNDFVTSVTCYINNIKCCDTDFCNGDDSTRIQYAKLPGWYTLFLSSFTFFYLLGPPTHATRQTIVKT